MMISKFRLGHIPEARNLVLFMCSHEKEYSTPVSEYTDGEEMVKLVCIPGNSHHIMEHRECTEFAIGITSVIIEWMLGLHSMNLSFDGKFTASHLYMTPSGQLKMNSSRKSFLKNITTEGKMQDRQTIAEIIERMLYGVNLVPEALPHDIVHLLWLLRNGNDEDDIVLAKHPGPMRGIQKLSLLILLLAQMESLKKRNPAKYSMIVQSLPFGNGEWIQRIDPLKHLMKVYNYKKRSSSYPKNASGMLLLERNGLAHLIAGYSITVRIKRLKVKGLRKAGNPKRSVKVHFTFNQISDMYSYAFPQALPKLQLSLHRQGEFESIYSDAEA